MELPVVINIVGFLITITVITVSQQRNASVAKRVAEDARIVALDVRSKLVAQELRLAEAMVNYHALIQQELRRIEDEGK
jgi:hypothetical protein